MRSEIPAITLLGVRIASVTADRALTEIETLHERGCPAIVAFANAHTLNVATADPEFAALLDTIDLLLNDGSGVAVAARLRRERFPDNLNGTDLSPRVLALARDRGWRVFLLGGKEGVAVEARRRLVEALPGLQIVGARTGFFGPEELATVVDEIRDTSPDLLFVGMGNPLQERWLAANLPATGARVGLAIGAFIDFSAGTVSRCPRWMSRLGIEWLYRLGLEPKRMWRRYVVGNPRFLWRALRDARRAR